jgi:hypothetical protein
MTGPTLLTKMLAFLAIDFLIVIISWYIPTDVTIARTIAAGIQFVFLAATAVVTTQFVVEDF